MVKEARDNADPADSRHPGLLAQAQPNYVYTPNAKNPLANLPLRKSNYQNTVVTVNRDKPGYQGFIAGDAAENLYGKIWASHVKKCAETRPYMQKAGDFLGPRWDGIQGYVERPGRYEEERRIF